MNKAIFLDRDGTINYVTDKYYITKPEDFIINEGVMDGMKLLRDRGFIFIVISNQSGIAKGLYSIEDAEKVHEFLIAELAKENIEIAEIYYCTHHPDTGGRCLCRKPGSLLIEKALARFHIDPAMSFLIGDAGRDIEAAERAGVKGILIKQNENILPYCESLLKE